MAMEFPAFLAAKDTSDMQAQIWNLGESLSGAATANTPIPYSPPLEDAFLPGQARIVAEVPARP